MTEVLRDDAAFIQSTAVIQRHVHHVEASVRRFLREKRAPPANESLHPCNSDGRGYRNSMRFFLIDHGLPEPDMTCLTEFEGVHNNVNTTNLWLDTPVSVDNVYDAIITRADTMYRNRVIIADTILGNWTTPDVNIHYLYNTTSKRCMINHVGGMRVGEKWYIFTTVTNKPRRKSVPLFHRQWLTEYIHAYPNASALAAPLQCSVPQRPPDSAPPDTPHILINDSTTILGSSGGFAGPYAFNSMYPEENPALISAMDQSDLSIQQADDALAPSSLAILLLPLAMNVIPLALISEAATTRATLLYALLTDVATVVPLSIKGVELVVIGHQRHRAIVMRLTAAVNGEMSESAAMELWGAQCRADGDILPAGIGFIVVALVFLLLGIVLELYARAYIKRKAGLQTMQGRPPSKSRRGGQGENLMVLKATDGVRVSSMGEYDGQVRPRSPSVGAKGGDEDGSGTKVDEMEMVVDVTGSELDLVEQLFRVELESKASSCVPESSR